MPPVAPDYAHSALSNAYFRQGVEAIIRYTACNAFVLPSCASPDPFRKLVCVDQEAVYLEAVAAGGSIAPFIEFKLGPLFDERVLSEQLH